VRTALVWFRRDPRVHDHPALTASATASSPSSCLLAGRFPSADRAWLLRDRAVLRLRFTPFHRAWERLERPAVHGAPRALRFPSGVAPGRLPASPEPDAADPLPPGERERALRRYGAVSGR